MDCYIGVDIGTSSTRAVLFNLKGKQMHIESIEYSIISRPGGNAELDADLVLDAFIRVIRLCVIRAKELKLNICGIGLSCQMHSLMGVDKSGLQVTELMVWADTRSEDQAHSILANYDVKDLYERTGCRVQHPMYPLSKILWLRQNRSEDFERVYKLITIKEYIIFKLYGEFIVDYTLAASQGYFNINNQQWDDRILGEILRIDSDKLSQVVECTFTLRRMNSEYASLLDVKNDIPFTIGSGDGIMANLGCGVTDSNALSCTIGTSGAIRTAVSKPLLDDEQRTWCYSFTKDMWVAGGAINNGGITLKWLANQFGKQFETELTGPGDSIYKLFDRYIAEIPVGAEGLIFLPYLTGERSPDWKANVRGLMDGLGLNHTRKHIVRAAMEGVMFRMFSVYEVMKSIEDCASEIRANGGYARSEAWLSMQADIFNKEISVPDVTEASALGAAFLCMTATGAVGSLTNILECMKPVKIIKPNPINHELYREAYSRAMKLYRKVY